MSELTDPISSVSCAKAIKAQAAIWLARANAGSWTEQDQVELETWLVQSRAHRAAYWRLEAAWAEAERLRVLSAPMKRIGAAKRRSHAPLKIATITVIAAIAGAAGFSRIHAPGMHTYETGIGGRQMLSLSDGSKIELNTNTTMRVGVGERTRQVWLDKGEAYFQIKHDAAHPFAVMVGDHKITDLGTKFLVHREEGGLRVTLLEGRARLDSTGTWAPHQFVELTPGDVAVATANSLSLVRKPEKTLTEELGWRRGLLIFDRTSLADAVAEINRYNMHKLVIGDAAVSRLTIDGTFPIHAVPEFTEVARALFGLRTEKRGNETLISR